MDYQGVEELLAIYCEANKEKIYKQNPEDIKQGMREYLREKLMSNCTSEDAQKNKEEMVQCCIGTGEKDMVLFLKP